jgi:YfiH family protein
VSGPPVLNAELLDALPGIRHGFFTRRGGVSRGIYESLNVGLGSADDPAAVAENRRLAAAALGASSLVTAYQAHSADAVMAGGAWNGAPPRADAIVIARPGVLLGVLTADCAPVLIADPVARIVGAVHAGWRGALSGVVASAVELMVEAGAARDRLTAAVGPCIGPASYEVGLEFEARFVSTDAASASHFVPGASPDKRLFDLPAFVLGRLAAAGVGACAWVGRDTCAEAAEFFSNRRAVLRGEPDYGRLLSVIALDE